MLCETCFWDTSFVLKSGVRFQGVAAQCVCVCVCVCGEASAYMPHLINEPHLLTQDIVPLTFITVLYIRSLAVTLFDL